VKYRSRSKYYFLLGIATLVELPGVAAFTAVEGATEEIRTLFWEVPRFAEMVVTQSQL
jgi:hypothetical protein